MYLVTILPGPWELTQEQFNNPIDPLIDEFRNIWEHGIQYPGTAGTPATPCDVSAAIVPLVQIFLLLAMLLEPSLLQHEKWVCAMVYTQKMKRMMMMHHLAVGLSAQEWRLSSVMLE